MYPPWLIAMAHVALWTSAISATGFCFVYAALAPWRATSGGRTVMALPASLAAVLDLEWFALVTHTQALWYVVIYVATFYLIPLALVSRTILLVRLQIAARRERASNSHLEKESTRS